MENKDRYFKLETLPLMLNGISGINVESATADFHKLLER
jgi:hypothetical protein